MSKLKSNQIHWVKSVQIRSYFWSVFGLNTKIYSINLRIQSEYRKIRTRNNYVFGHFSSSAEITSLCKKPLPMKILQFCGHLMLQKHFIVYKIKRKPVQIITSYCWKCFKQVRNISKGNLRCIYLHHYQPE